MISGIQINDHKRGGMFCNFREQRFGGGAGANLDADVLRGFENFSLKE
jgi:hypothetical protein